MPSLVLISGWSRLLVLLAVVSGIRLYSCKFFFVYLIHTCLVLRIRKTNNNHNNNNIGEFIKLPTPRLQLVNPFIPISQSSTFIHSTIRSRFFLFFPFFFIKKRSLFKYTNLLNYLSLSL
jgi:hypothetical protein